VVSRDNVRAFRLSLQGYPTPKVTVTQKAPEFSDSPSTYKRRLLRISREPLDIGGSEKSNPIGSRPTR